MENIHSSISFGIVNIPILMNPIIKDNDTSFNQLHKKCKNRIKYIQYCPHCKKEVKETDIIKGYQYEKDNYVVFQKEELEELKPENEHEINVISFIKMDEIPPVYFEKSYFLNTEKKSKAYTLFYEALKKTKMVALAKCVLSSKFYYCILRLTESEIIMTTLYFNEEINIPETTLKEEKMDKELDMAIKLIESMKAKFEPSKYKDEYQDNIRKAIDDKLNGKELKGKKKTNKKQIGDLMEALEKSLKK